MKRLLYIVFPLLFGACSLIDDDLTVCGDELVIDYQVQLHTELELQLETELSMELEEPVRLALEEWLSPIFTDKAKDIDLRFYLGETDEMRHRIQEIINDNRTSYTIRLPKEDYMHLAVANMADNRQVQLSAGEHSETMGINLVEGLDFKPLTTGIFTGRLPMIMNDTTRHFDVEMYMITSAVALVIDTTLCPHLWAMDGYMLGSADSFSVRDSIFTHERGCAIALERLPLAQSSHKPQQAGVRKQAKAEDSTPLTCMTTVSLPSKDEEDSWSLTVTATLNDNRHTTTTLTIKEPLEAGTLRIIKCYMDENGELKPDIDFNPEVGATVTFDWNEGNGHDIDI